jgi:hypothetical protein
MGRQAHEEGNLRWRWKDHGGARDVARQQVWCDGPILANAKFTHEHTNFVIILLALSQFQTLILHSSCGYQMHV